MSELYWAAGFFDGEGCTTCRPSGKPRKDGSQYKTLRLYVKQANKEELERFQRAVGVGTIQGPFEPNSSLGKKEFWFWEVCSKDGALDAIMKLYPLLCTPKRDQMVEAMTEKMNSDKIAWNALARLELMIRSENSPEESDLYSSQERKS